MKMCFHKLQSIFISFKQFELSHLCDNKILVPSKKPNGHSIRNLLIYKVLLSVYFLTVLQAFKDIWTNERLLNLVEQIIGPDIAGNPVWNLRTKVPQNEITTVPWHQGKMRNFVPSSNCFHIITVS